ESARRIRFEPVPGIIATDVQNAILQVVQSAILLPSTAVTFGLPYTVNAADRILLVDTAGGSGTILMMSAAGRNGVDLTIKDITGHAAANVISVAMSGLETADGLDPYPIDSNFAAVRFVPQAGGYYVAP